MALITTIKKPIRKGLDVMLKNVVKDSLGEKKREDKDEI